MKRTRTAQQNKNGPTMLPGFHEAFPNVWIPRGYTPTEWEVPAPVIRTAGEQAEEYLKCKNSLAYFVHTHCWSLHTDDPSGDPTYRKFPVYPYLLKFFHTVDTVENYHIEKSRQLLMSWAWMAVFLWDILFHDDWANLCLSRKESLVDDGGFGSTPDSLFGKVRVMWSALPAYLQHPLEFRHLRVTCPSTSSYLKGEASTPRAGRGASYNRALLDEAAHIEHSETLFRGLRQAAKTGLILNSTPMGKGNLFARIRFNPRTRFRRLSFHWSEHPERANDLYCDCGWQSDEQADETIIDQFHNHICNVLEDDHGRMIKAHANSAWYDEETKDMTPEQIASEFDLSYEKSQRGRVFEPFDPTKHVFDFEEWDGWTGQRALGENDEAFRERYLRFVLDPRLTTVCGWDFGVGDPTSLVLGQVVNDSTMTIRWLDEFEMSDEDWSFYGKFVTAFWARIVLDVTGMGILHYGDPSGKNRSLNLDSWISNLGDAGIKIVTTPRKGGVLEWVDFVAAIIRRKEFEVSLWNTHMIDALTQYHFPLDSEGQPVPGEHLPVHDQWSHSMSAMRYVYQFRYAHRLKRVYRTQQSDIRKLLRAGHGNRMNTRSF